MIVKVIYLIDAWSNIWGYIWILFKPDSTCMCIMSRSYTLISSTAVFISLLHKTHFVEDSSLWTYFSRCFWIYFFVPAYGEINAIYKHVLGIFSVLFQFLAEEKILWFHQFVFKKPYMVIIHFFFRFSKLIPGRHLSWIYFWSWKFWGAFVNAKLFLHFPPVLSHVFQHLLLHLLSCYSVTIFRKIWGLYWGEKEKDVHEGKQR